MKICLKSGQTVDLGDVKYAWTFGEDNRLWPLKYCKDGAKLLCLENLVSEDEDITFVTDKQEFECKTEDVVGILYEVE